MSQRLHLVGFKFVKKTSQVNEDFIKNMKAKYREKVKLYYMDTYSFIFYIKTKDIYSDIKKDVKKIFDTLN